jgi:hypothetical protein
MLVVAVELVEILLLILAVLVEPVAVELVEN